MKQFTKEQLIEAQKKYNKNLCKDPEKFEENTDFSNPETAVLQIEYLISLIE